MPKNINFFNLSVLILALSAVLNVGMRFLPTSAFTFRTQEAAGLDYNSLGNFSANGTFHAEHAYGDLSAMGNYRDFRHYRTESFTTDQCGNRDNPEILLHRGPVDKIFLGSSFTNGISLGDHDTLAEQYTQASGIPTYNGARNHSYSSVYSLTSLLSLAHALNMKPGGTFIFELQARYSVNIENLDLGNFKILPLDQLCRSKTFFSDPIWYLHNREGLSPLSIFSQNLVKWFQDDKTLPNPQRDLVLIRHLKNGEPMLFLNTDPKTYTTERSEEDAFLFFKTFSSVLAKNGYSLNVLLMPDKYDVYAPLFQEPSPEATRTPLYFERLERRLQSSGIPVLNFLPIFRARARDALASGKTIYWMDDTHWNPDGVKIAVESLLNFPKVDSHRKKNLFP